MGKKIWLSMHPRNFVVTCSHVIVRPSVDTRGIQCKIHVTQSTGMENPNTTRDVLAGNCMAPREGRERERKRKQESR